MNKQTNSSVAAAIAALTLTGSMAAQASDSANDGARTSAYVRLDNDVFAGTDRG